MAEFEIEVPDFKASANRMVEFTNRHIPVKVANHAYLFFDGSFDNQGFTDATLIPWKKTKGGKRNVFGAQSAGILIGTGALRSSMRPSYGSGEARVTAGGDHAPYAVIHNDGGEMLIRITRRSKKYFWFKYKQTGDVKWKALALTKKKKIRIKIPKRQFIGHSRTLTEELDKLIITEFRAEEFRIFGTTTIRL